MNEKAVPHRLLLIFGEKINVKFADFIIILSHAQRLFWIKLLRIQDIIVRDRPCICSKPNVFVQYVPKKCVLTSLGQYRQQYAKCLIYHITRSYLVLHCGTLQASCSDPNQKISCNIVNKTIGICLSIDASKLFFMNSLPCM